MKRTRRKSDMKRYTRRKSDMKSTRRKEKKVHEERMI